MRLYKPYISLETFSILIEGSLRSIPFHFFISLLLAIDLLFNNAPTGIVLGWLFAVWGVSACRMLNAYYTLNKRHFESHRASALARLLLFTAIIGGLWSSAYFLFLPYVAELHEFIIILVLGGMAAGSLTALSVYIPAYLSFILPMLLPIVVYQISLMQFDNIVLGLMFLVYIALLMVVAHFNSGIIINIVKLTREKDALITALKKSNEKLNVFIKKIQVLSVTDSLTGLYNRRFFDRNLKNEVGRLRRNGYPLSLVMMDIDNFKLINDTYGHPEGDQFLKKFSALLRHYFKRANDDVYRIGGDEFAVIMVNMPLKEAADFCESFQNKFNEFNRHKNVSLSIGLVTIDQRFNQNYMNVVTEADKALYQAKEQGKDQIVYKDVQAVPDAL